MFKYKTKYTYITYASDNLELTVPTWYFSCVTSVACGVVTWTSSEKTHTVYRPHGRFCDSRDCNANPAYSHYTFNCSDAFHLKSSYKISTSFLLTSLSFNFL